MKVSIKKTQIDELIKQAKQAKKKSYCPYSKFPVGASVLTGKGKIYQGCNVENSSYGLSICAERTAIFNTIAGGETEIIALCVVGDGSKWISPCGACRQVIYEFGKNVLIIMVRGDGKIKQKQISCLLPEAFKL
ncbi:cytidine deaminase [bacterium]|nr:cytidine deaminase [bacterium]